MDAAESTIDSPFGVLSIRRATHDDAPALRALRNGLARWMRRRGIQQWRPGEISVEWIERCIEHGIVYVISHGEMLAGSVTVLWDDPLIWGEQLEPAGYLHTLMLDRSFAGHGVGRSIVKRAEYAIRDSERGIARLDCPTDNPTMRAYYEAAGYRFVGAKIPCMEGARETALYEKSLGGKSV